MSAQPICASCGVTPATQDVCISHEWAQWCDGCVDDDIDHVFVVYKDANDLHADTGRLAARSLRSARRVKRMSKRLVPSYISTPYTVACVLAEDRHATFLKEAWRSLQDYLDSPKDTP